MPLLQRTGRSARRVSHPQEENRELYRNGARTSAAADHHVQTPDWQVQPRAKSHKVPSAQSGSAQSTMPSQSLSELSKQYSTVPLGQVQTPPEHSLPWVPQDAPSHTDSSQSVCPSQSLSWLSAQMVSLVCTVPPLPAQSM